MKVEVEICGMNLKAKKKKKRKKKAKDFCQTQEARRDAWNGFFLRASRRNQLLTP